MNKELEELMSVAQVNGKRKEKIREDFANYDTDKKKAFLDEFRWGIIKTTNKTNYA